MVLAPRHRARRGELALAALTLATVVFAASREDSNPAGRATAGATSDAPARAVTLPDGAVVQVPAHPTRIVPASTGLLDWLAPLVAPERLAAIPNLTEDYAVVARGPGSAALLARPRFVEFRAEALGVFAPDLVLVQEWHAAATRARLEELGIAVALLPEVATFEELVAATRALGDLVDEPARAAALVGDLEARREALQRARRGRAPRVLVYSNFNSGAVGSVTARGTTMDLCLALAGTRNAAAERGLVGHADADLELLFALDPDVLVVSTGDDGSSATLDYLRATRALDHLGAVARGHVVRLDGRLVGAASHHVVDAAEALARELERHGL